MGKPFSFFFENKCELTLKVESEISKKLGINPTVVLDV